MYKHLISTQRSQIFAYKQCGKSVEFIANAIGVHKSTIYRELSRNSNKRGGYAHNAHEMAMERQERIVRNATVSGKIKFECLQRIRVSQWSPEQISGALKQKGVNVSHTTIINGLRKTRRPEAHSLNTCVTKDTGAGQTHTGRLLPVTYLTGHP